jgi:hypothetical protein
MFSSKPKKVHYERGTKGERSARGHRSSGSRDSGVGSSSASDRASLGTSPENDTSFTYLDIENQRNTPSAVKEALDAANEKIKQLEAANTQLNSQLSESNKENRSLKRERVELLNKVDFLLDDLEDEKEKNAKSKRESSPRTGAAAAPVASKHERRSTPPKKDTRGTGSRRCDDERSQGSHRERRESWREMPVPLFDRPPAAPQPPSNTSNPFMPKSSRPPSISVAYPPSSVAYAQPGQVTYAPAPITYATAPAYPPRSPSDHFPNDGRYHPYPL